MTATRRYRACYADYGQSQTVLTAPLHATLPYNQIVEEAVAEAYRAQIIRDIPDEGAGIETEAQLRERLVVGMWTEL